MKSVLPAWQVFTLAAEATAEAEDALAKATAARAQSVPLLEGQIESLESKLVAVPPPGRDLGPRHLGQRHLLARLGEAQLRQHLHPPPHGRHAGAFARLEAVRSRWREIDVVASVGRPRGGSGRAGAGRAVGHGHAGAGRSVGGAPHVPLWLRHCVRLVYTPC